MATLHTRLERVEAQMLNDGILLVGDDYIIVISPREITECAGVEVIPDLRAWWLAKQAQSDESKHDASA